MGVISSAFGRKPVGIYQQTEQLRSRERAKFLLFCAIYIISCTFFVYYLYSQAKQTIDRDLNNRLYYGAVMASAILGQHYHDHLVDKTSKTEAEDWDAIQRLTHYSHEMGLTYLYTVIVRDGKAILVSSSASDNELKEKNYVRFFDPYPDASSKLLEALRENRIIWSDYNDHWGQFRAVFVPMTSADGTRYIAGAEVSMDKYDQQLHGQELHLAGFSIFLFVDFSIFVAIYFYVMYIRKHVTQVQRHAQAIQETKDATESAYQAKSRFVAVMSHEIRTPLNGVLGAADLLHLTPLDTAQQNLLSIIDFGGKSLLTIVNDILELSKIEANKVVFEPESFAIAGLVHSVVALIRPQVKSNNVTLTEVIASDVPELIRTDAEKLQKILINLLGNAAKFTHEGEIRLEVSVVKRDNERLQLRFLVQDSGIGIAADDQRQLFEPFSQIDSHASGTGLGLSICKHFVEIMGGAIWVTSEPHQGACFAFDIPCQEVSHLDSNPLDLEVPSQHSVSLHALVVDDSVLNQSLIRLMLERFGHTVDIVDDGAKVLPAVQATEYDVIFMDINMKNMDGMQATRTIRQQTDIHQPFIIAYTANAADGDIESYKAIGMDDVLVKPVLLKNVHTVLKSIIEGKRNRSSYK